MVDIYDNLDNYEDVGAEAKLASENESLKIKLSESQAAFNKLKKGIFQDFDKLFAEHEQLSFNFSSLLKTARAEIERKTNAITQLNIEKDMLMIQSLKDKTNKPHAGRQYTRAWSKPKQIEFANERRKKCGDDDKPVPSDKPDQFRLKGQMNERTSDGLKRIQEYPENQDHAQHSLLRLDPRQRFTVCPESAQSKDMKLSPGSHGKENDDSLLKLTPGRIADRRKSMPALTQPSKFSTDEDDDDIKSSGSRTYLPSIEEMNEGIKRDVDEKHMKSGEVSPQHNMREAKLTHERYRDRVIRNRHDIDFDSRSAHRGRERGRFEGNFKRRKQGGLIHRRNPSLGSHIGVDRSRSPPYDRYRNSRSRDRRSHFERHQPVFECDRQKQTYRDSHHAKQDLHDIDVEPPYKKRKTERSKNSDVMIHTEQIRGLGKEILTESSQSSRQSSVRQEERNNRHIIDFHNKNEVIPAKHIARKNKEMLLTKHTQNPRDNIDDEASQTKQITEILAADAQQKSRQKIVMKISLRPEGKTHEIIKDDKCKKSDDSFRHTIDSTKTTVKPLHVNDDVTERRSSMSMESGEIDDTDAHSSISTNSSFNCRSNGAKNTVNIERRRSPRKSAHIQLLEKLEKEQRVTSSKNNEHDKRADRKNIKVATTIVPIEDQPDPSCITAKYKIPKKNKDKLKEVLPSSDHLKLDGRLPKHSKPQDIKKDQTDNKKSSESTKSVVSNTSKSRSSKKLNEDKIKETVKTHNKESPSQAAPSNLLEVNWSLIKDLPAKVHTNVKDKESSERTTDLSTKQPMAQPSSNKSDETKHDKKDIGKEGRRKSKDKLQETKIKGSVITDDKRKSRENATECNQSNKDRDKTETMFRNLTSKTVVEGDLQLSDDSSDSIDIYGGIIENTRNVVPETKDSNSVTPTQTQNDVVEKKTVKSDSKGDDSKSKDINAKLCELFGDSSSLVTLEDLIPTQNTERQGSTYIPSPCHAALMAQNEYWEPHDTTSQHNDDHTKIQTRSSTRLRKDSDEKKTNKNLNTGDELKSVSDDNSHNSKKNDLEINERIVSEKSSTDIDLPSLDEVIRKELQQITSPTVGDIPLENMGTVEVPLSINIPLPSSNEGEFIRVIPPSDDPYDKDIYKTVIISTGMQPQCVKDAVTEDANSETETQSADAPVVIKEPIGQSMATLLGALATSTPLRPQKDTQVTELMQSNLPVLDSIADSRHKTDKTEESIPQNSTSNCSQSQSRTDDVDVVRIVMNRKRRR